VENTHGRQLVEEHADLCIAAGINFEGINQEVACGQWEFQLFAQGAKKQVTKYGQDTFIV
jgi:glutamine synthetase